MDRGRVLEHLVVEGVAELVGDGGGGAERGGEIAQDARGLPEGERDAVGAAHLAGPRRGVDPARGEGPAREVLELAREGAELAEDEAARLLEAERRGLFGERGEEVVEGERGHAEHLRLGLEIAAEGGEGPREDAGEGFDHRRGDAGAGEGELERVAVAALAVEHRREPLHAVDGKGEGDPHRFPEFQLQLVGLFAHGPFGVEGEGAELDDGLRRPLLFVPDPFQGGGDRFLEAAPRLAAHAGELSGELLLRRGHLVFAEEELLLEEEPVLRERGPGGQAFVEARLHGRQGVAEFDERALDRDLQGVQPVHLADRPVVARIHGEAHVGEGVQRLEEVAVFVIQTDEALDPAGLVGRRAGRVARERAETGGAIGRLGTIFLVGLRAEARVHGAEVPPW